MTYTTSRQGTLLIIVAGLSAMLAALSATYLSSIRSRERDTDQAYVDAQSRILLNAACAFIVDHGSANVQGVYPFYSWNRSSDALGPAPADFDAAEGCPTDTWFRIYGAATPFTVTVGVDLSRGISDAANHGAESGAMPAALKDAIGVPVSGDVAKLQRLGHREHYEVHVSGTTITTINRIYPTPALGSW